MNTMLGLILFSSADDDDDVVGGVHDGLLILQRPKK